MGWWRGRCRFATRAGYNYAEVTAGGVALTEIDPATMESRVCRGLFLVGEILDVDGRHRRLQLPVGVGDGQGRRAARSPAGRRQTLRSDNIDPINTVKRLLVAAAVVCMTSARGRPGSASLGCHTCPLDHSPPSGRWQRAGGDRGGRRAIAG